MMKASIIFTESIGSGAAGMAPGIHIGAKFTGISAEGTWIDINFSNEAKETIRKRLFAPSGTMLLELEKDGVKVMETPVEALRREEGRNLAIVTAVLHAVLPEADFDKFEGKDYNDFIAKAVVSLNKFKNSLVNLKVNGKKVLSKVTKKTNIYADIQNYPGFIEKYVEGEETRLKFSAKELAVLEPDTQKTKSDDDLGI